jgi:hypothetical protein
VRCPCSAYPTKNVDRPQRHARDGRRRSRAMPAARTARHERRCLGPLHRARMWSHRVLPPATYAMSDPRSAAQFGRVTSFSIRRELIEYQNASRTCPDRPPDRTRRDDARVAPLRCALRARDRRRTCPSYCIEGARHRNVAHFIPMHHHPYCRKRWLGARRLSRSRPCVETMISLPLYTRATGAEVDRVVAAVTEIVRTTNRARRACWTTASASSSARSA